MMNSLTQQLRPHAMVSDGMVLQRDADTNIWGWSDPGEHITVHFLNHAYQATADLSGKWSVTLQKLEAGGPYCMEIEGREKIVLHDILVGDVWLCSGQSNMQLPMERVADQYANIVADYTNPFIRQFDVPERFDFDRPCESIKKSKWISVSHESILNFTAVGFFFAKALYEKYQVPIGLIKTAIGGACLEAWMSREALREYPDILKIADRFRDDRYVRELTQREENREKQWYTALDASDQGLQGDRLPWFAEDYDDSDWESMQIPAYWADEGLTVENGAFWFRKDILLPSSLAGLPARILMGRIVDADFVYINGQLVGSTAYQYPPRKYPVPAGLLKAGRNTIAVRVISNRGKGGFITEKPYQLRFSSQIIDLSGDWKYRVGTSAEILPDKTFFPQIPVGLFNGMLSPITDYTVKGVLWYQGESNTSRPENYEALFIRMIKDWRKALRQENLPFLYAQLPNYLEREDMRAVNQWPLIRDAQLKALAVPNTAMAVTIDVGEWNDLHPLDKQSVGKRLALAAMQMVYADTHTVGMGPIFHHMTVQGNQAVLFFTNTGSGLCSKDGKALRCFEIAWEDGVYYEAQADIAGDQVIVSSCHVHTPVAVRYAWCDSPRDINFYNREGLPASPFRTHSGD